MYNVLIADDEPSIQEGMRLIINWGLYNFRVLDTASDGEEALRKIKHGRYDLVITDIRMPVLNGIEFIQAVKSYNPSIRILIISGYSDFSYAKKACEYGVIGYLLKPVDSRELAEDLSRVKKELDEDLRLELMSRDNLAIIKDKFLYDLVRNTLTNGEIQKQLYHLDLSFPAKRIGVALLKIDDFIDTVKTGLKDAKLMMFGVRNIVEELLSKDFDGMVYQDNQAVLGLLLFGSQEELQFEIAGKKLTALSESISGHLGIKISIGYGGFCEGYRELKKGWERAGMALDRQMMAGGSTVVNYKQVEVRLTNITEVHWEPKNLFLAVECNHVKSIKEETQLLIREISEEKPSKEAVKALLYGTLLGLLNLLKCYNGNSSHVIESESDFDRVFGSMETGQISAWLNNTCLKAAAYINELKGSKSKVIINQIKKYINSHYSSDLSLKSIARIFYLNPAYLGQLFKNNFKESFNDYLNRLRIGEAKRLTIQEDLRIQDLIEKTGFSSPEYFYKLFKKYEGISFSEFKQSFHRKG